MALNLKTILAAAPATVGGQAVIEGVMMRSGKNLAIAVRKPGGDVEVVLRPWFSLVGGRLAKTPFLRGFPVLLETLVNGIKALNVSAQKAVEEEEEGEISPLHLFLTLLVSIGLALGLFVVLPHFFSLSMKSFGAGGDVDSLSFHAWDGVFKLLLFAGYILAISLVPDIRRVFQYHGAEHKAIWAYEDGKKLTPENTRAYSTLHPRCGTAFLLFVLAVSIVLYAVIVPLLVAWWAPESVVLKHSWIVAVKLLFMIPISAVAYEMIRLAGKFRNNFFCKAMIWPGLMMQILTTREPDDRQVEVAIAALRSAVGGKAPVAEPVEAESRNTASDEAAA